MANIQVGTVVQLKSSGPAMTVRWIEENEAYCEWFSGDKVDGATFPLHSLKLKE